MTGAFAEVLARYPQPIRTLEWWRVESSGGLSGAEIWRGDRNAHPLFAAKCYPVAVEPRDVTRRQFWCDAAVRAGLSFVPPVLPTKDGQSVVVHAGRCWEVSTWMPGKADFAERPSRAKLLSACDAVIRLLEVWRGFGTRTEVPPAVLNRLALFAEWEKSFHALPTHPTVERRPIRGRSDAQQGLTPDLTRRVIAGISIHLPKVRAELQPWAARKLPCQPCIRDLRSEHFLFTADELTGLIDYGAAAWDTPATDAARMLGELAGGVREMYELGIARFAEGLGAAVCPPELVRVLEHSGVVGSVIHWMNRLRNGVVVAPIKEIEMRLEKLVGRLESLGNAGSTG